MKGCSLPEVEHMRSLQHQKKERKTFPSFEVSVVVR